MHHSNDLPKYVHYIAHKKRYRVSVYTGHHKQQHVGYFETISEAQYERDVYCREHNIQVKEKRACEE